MSFQSTAPCFLTFRSSDQSLLLFKTFVLNTSYVHSLIRISSIGNNLMAVAIDTNSLVALRATKLLLTPTQSLDYILITAQYR